jgi:hypothetical protein
LLYQAKFDESNSIYPYEGVRMMSFHVGLLAVLVGVLAFSPPAGAKIYIWTDDNARTHYCNDPDDVPKDYKDKCRTIECQGVRTPTSSSERPKAQSIQPASSPQRQGEMEELMKDYKAKRKAMQDYRRAHQNFQTSEYEDLKRQIGDIKSKLIRKKPSTPAP